VILVAGRLSTSREGSAFRWPQSSLSGIDDLAELRT
jgi:hypothetical protein